MQAFKTSLGTIWNRSFLSTCLLVYITIIIKLIVNENSQKRSNTLLLKLTACLFSYNCWMQALLKQNIPRCMMNCFAKEVNGCIYSYTTYFFIYNLITNCYIVLFYYFTTIKQNEMVKSVKLFYVEGSKFSA